MRLREHLERVSFLLAALMAMSGVLLVPLAQSASYTLTPVGPLGVGHARYYTATPAGYPTHLFLGNWFQSSDEGGTWVSTLVRYPGIAGVVIEDRADPLTLYMSCYPGPFARSLNEGQSWQVISLPFGENNRGWSLTQDTAGVLYLQASNDGTNFYLYTSSDRGLNWSQIQINHGKNKMADGSMVFPFWADPVIPGMLYAFRNSTNNSAFLVTVDGGKNWKRREGGMPHRPSGRLQKAFNPSSFAQSSVPPYSIYAIGNLKQYGYYTDDRGKHWHSLKKESAMPTYMIGSSLHVKPGTNDTLWALGNLSGSDQQVCFAESLDKGRTWTMKGTILPSEGWTDSQMCGWECPSIVPRSLDIYRGQPSNMLVTKSGNIVINKPPEGLLLSTDSGNSFEVHNAGAMGWSFDQLFRASDGAIYASSHDPYLWRSDNNGQTWRLCDWAPYISLRERANGDILGMDWGEEIWSYSQGKMALLAGGPPVGGSYPAMELVPLESKQRILLGGSQDNASFFRSDDLGTTWTTLGTVPSLTGLMALSADPRNPDALVVAGWNGYPGCGPFSSPYDALAGGIYRSSDGGITWTAAMDGKAIGGVTCLYRDKQNPDILVASAMGYSWDDDPYWPKGGVFVSLDGGASWQRRSRGLPAFVERDQASMISAVVSPPDGQTLFAAVQLNGGIYRSDDLGLTWTKIADLPLRLPDATIQDNLCMLTIRRSAVTQIMPLGDGTGSILIATMGQGLFIATPTTAKAAPPVPPGQCDRFEARRTRKGTPPDATSAIRDRAEPAAE